MADLVLMTKPARQPAKHVTAHVRATLLSLRSWRGRRGPHGVLASLMRGLSSLEVAFALNPRRVADQAALGVLSNLDALAQAIHWRRQGSLARLVAGPNLVVLPSDVPELMCAPEIDLCVVPSTWVKELYEQDCPSLRGRLAVWPAGVDCAYWSPAERDAAPPRRALVFRKLVSGQRNASEDDLEAACKLLCTFGYAVTRLQYGDFSHRAYRHALRACDLCVVFGAAESQGLALVEAWSVGVPTLVFLAESWRYRDRTYPCSAAPYLSEETGAFFASVEELGSLLARWEELAAAFDPRGWVLRNMADGICARSYHVLIQGERSG